MCSAAVTGFARDWSGWNEPTAYPRAWSGAITSVESAPERWKAAHPVGASPWPARVWAISGTTPSGTARKTASYPGSGVAMPKT